MECHLLPIFLLVCTVFAASVVSLPDLAPEEYWHSKLPKTPMPPPVLQQLLSGRGGNKLSFANDVPDAEKEVIFDESYFNLKNPPLSGTNMFFRYNSLKPGTKMSLFWSNAGNKVSFLTRQEAESIPFETKKLHQILQILSIKPNSPQADMIKNTLSSCERPNVHGEDKFCATSLESLIDYTLFRLGKNGVKVISTPNAKRQEYTVVSDQTKKIGDRAVTCHREKYGYAVYMCHEFSASEAHVVPLAGADGTRVDAISLCHMDTSRWNPDFFGFKALNTKPGQDPICHFINADGLVWYRQN